jgi:hypothetical protein
VSPDVSKEHSASILKIRQAMKMDALLTCECQQPLSEFHNITPFLDLLRQFSSCHVIKRNFRVVLMPTNNVTDAILK